MVLSKNIIYPKIVLYVDNEPRCFICRSNETDQIAQIASKKRLYRLEELLSKKCITSKYFDRLKNDIDNALSSKDFSTFSLLLKSIEYYLEDAEDCAYIRECKINLRFFLQNLVIEYQEELKNGYGKKRSIRNIIETFFDSSNIIMANLANDEDPDSIAEILMFEVVEFYGSSAWDDTEMYINDLSPLDREKIVFSNLVEILRGSCDECS